jgi:PAS domain S-box-containing protein
MPERKPWKSITTSVLALTALALVCDTAAQLLFAGDAPGSSLPGRAALLGFAVFSPVLFWALLKREEQRRRKDQTPQCAGEDHYKTLFRNAADAIFYADLNGRFLEVNEAAEQQTGYSRAELLSRRISDIEPDHTPEAFAATLAAIQATGAACFESRLARKDGSVYPVEIRVGIVEIRGKSGLLGVARDISLRTRTEEALEHEALRRQILMEKSLDGIVTFDQEHRVVEANERFAAMLGYSREETLGMHTWDFEALTTEEQIRRDFADLTNISLVFETRHRRKDGSFLPVEVSASGALVGGEALVFCVCRDISARKEAEDALLKQNRLQELLMDMASTYINLPLEQFDAAIAASLASMGTFVDADRAYLFEYDFEREVSRNTHAWCAAGIEPQIGSLQAVPFSCMGDCVDRHRRGEPYYIEDVLALPPEDRSRRTLEPQGIKSLMLVPLMDGDACTGFVGLDSVRGKRVYTDVERRLLVLFAQMMSNVASRRQLQANLETARRKSEAANLAKNEFLANMSHEIRTPLNGVLGMLQLLKQDVTPGERAQFTNMALGAGTRLLSLLNDILDFSKIEVGHLRLVSRPFTFRSLFAEVESVFSLTAQKKGLALSFRIDPSVPDTLSGDKARIRQVLFNLVGNSLKFTHTGSVQVDVWANPARQFEDKTWAYFAISDTGIGIPDDKQAHVFERFTQTDASPLRQYEGAGLGLAIVKRLLALMGGGVCMDSKIGQGTTIYLRLLLENTAQNEQGTRLAPHAPTMRPLRILLADDEPIGQLSMRMLLGHLGHTVRTATSGLEVLETLLNGEFDCVLMDVQMPEMGGVEATRIIRSAPEFRDKAAIPIIALTAYAMSGDREKFLEAGMDEHVGKPVQLDELTRLLERVSLRTRTH